jgi:hypothetical protein
MLLRPAVYKGNNKITELQSESVSQGRIDNVMDKRKRIKVRTTIYKTLHITLKIQ